MKLRENLRISWRAIRSHKLRSTLTTLGIIIGVGAVITFVTLGASLQADIIGEVGGDEVTNIYVWAGPEGTNQGPGFGAEPVFTNDDVDSIAALESVETAVPYTLYRTDRLVYRGDGVTRQEALRLTSPSFLADEEFAVGENFESGTNQVVLTPSATTMWGPPVAVGDTITVTRGDANTTLSVVGILNSSDSNSVFERFDGNSRIYASPETFGERRFLSLTVEATGPNEVDTAKESIRAYLRADSGVTASLPDDYVVNLQTSEELLDQIRELLDTLTGFVTSIALISLVVGAIGIANIMLVSVTERTREIGIMKAVGAQRRDILALFLTEAVILGLVGAVVGAVLGAIAGFAGTQFLEFDAYVFPLQWAIIATVVGILVGVVAGLYPAWNASRTDPIDALRYE